MQAVCIDITQGGFSPRFLLLGLMIENSKCFIFLAEMDEAVEMQYGFQKQAHTVF